MADPRTRFLGRGKPGRREQPAHVSLSSRATLVEVPLTGLSFKFRRFWSSSPRSGSLSAALSRQPPSRIHPPMTLRRHKLRSLRFSKNRRCASRRLAVATTTSVEQLESRIALTVSPFEQEFVYLLNRARHNPAAYQVERGLAINLSSITPRQPLAVNSQLTDAAGFKSDDMAERNYFLHTSVTGETPNQLARRFGYDLPERVSVGGQTYLLPTVGNQIESLAGGRSSPSAALQGLIESTGHRNHLLGVTAHNQVAKDVGIGYRFRDQAAYRHYWTVLITPSKVTTPFLTGVAFVDGNSNSRFEGNEGIGSVTITAAGPNGRFITTTAAAGGWAMPVPAGDYVVTASGGAFAGSSSAPVRVGSQNVAVDFVSGTTTAWVNFSQANVAVPGLPTGVVATAGNARAALTWTAPASNGGGAITNYVIQFSSNGGSSWTTFNRTASTSTAATVTGLVNGTNYVFRVAAVNTAGTGGFSVNSNSVRPAAQSGISQTTSISGSVGVAGEVDTYSVSVPSGSLIRAVVDAANNGLSPLVELASTSGTILKQPIAFNQNSADLGLYELNAGAAVIRVRAQAGRTGAYTLNVTVTTREELVLEVIRLTNLERQRAGLSSLARSSLLEQAAQAHVQDMDNRNSYLGHTGSNGSSPQNRIQAVGYKMAWVREGSQLRGIRLENAAHGQMSAADVVQSWMNSSGHRAAIMDAATKEIGVGFKYDAETGRTYWIQKFGNPWQPGMSLWF